MFILQNNIYILLTRVDSYTCWILHCVPRQELSVRSWRTTKHRRAWTCLKSYNRISSLHLYAPSPLSLSAPSPLPAFHLSPPSTSPLSLPSLSPLSPLSPLSSLSPLSLSPSLPLSPLSLRVHSLIPCSRFLGGKKFLPFVEKKKKH